MRLLVSCALVILLILICHTGVYEGTMCERVCRDGWTCMTWVDPLGYSPTFSSCEPE